MTRHELIKALRDAAGSSESLFEKHESDLMYEAADMLENGIEAPWIPIKTREVREDDVVSDDIGFIFDCPMPEIGEHILICGKNWVHEDYLAEGYNGEIVLDIEDDWENVIAWMPMPKPYEESDT